MTKPLPASLLQICADYGLPALMLPAVQRLTAEACRLQQEADMAFARGQGAQAPRERAALVVEG